MQVQLFEGLKSEQIGYLGLDVYEQEADLFYETFPSASFRTTRSSV